MKKVSQDEIKTAAYKAIEENVHWHFHILSPTCRFNGSNDYVFVFERPDEHILLANHADAPQKDLGKELSPLLHGKDVMDKNSSDKNYEPSEKVKEMREVALRLNSKNTQWHHHMLFKECEFNSHSPNFVLILEDQESGDIYENVTEYEPSEDIKQIEKLFYANTP